MRPIRLVLTGLLAIVFLFTGVEPGHAQFGKLKDKVKKKVEDKVDKKIDKTLEGKKAEDPSTAETDTLVEPAAVPAGEEFQLYTKFDFVPGQKVLYYDDLSSEEIGEFPSRWNLNSGVFEVAKVGQEPWIMASARGEISPKINVTQLPEKYTIEFEFLNRTGVYTGGHSIRFDWLNANALPVASLELWNNRNAIFVMKDDKNQEQRVSDKKLPESYKKGIHNFRMMVTNNSVKCYLDNERLVNAPRTTGFAATGFGIAFNATPADLEQEKMFIRNFRFAEGGKEMKQQIGDSGRVVLHGIYFDVNSDKIRGESYKTLADIAQMLTDDAALKLTIEGHTDSDGEDAFNMDLSQRRADAVKKYLSETYKFDAARLEAKGFGESKPIDVNTTPEGKANNRRVELVKI